MAKYEGFIPQNVAMPNATKIVVYNPNGKQVGSIALHGLKMPETGEKLYSFGVLSDVHIGQSTATEDFTEALKFLSEETDFICISGDLVHENSDSQRTTYKSLVDAHAKVPVYACAGNHDGYASNTETIISSYTGHPLYYSVTQGNDVFIFVGTKSNITGALFTTAELQWLYETLEANRNKRCFVFQHVRPDDSCGNALGIYTYDIWGGTEQNVFESLLRHYKNVVFFHGHSHLKFNLQLYSELANIDKKFGSWSVHVPSITVPRSTNSVVNPSRVELFAESEGYVVDVYENGVHLRGRDFVKGAFLPIASYWLDTTIKKVEAGTYADETGTLKTYKAIEYIETSNTQYINTEFYPNQDTRVVCEFMYLSGTEIYGCRTSTTVRNFSMRAASSSWQVSYRNGYSSVPGISSNTKNWYIADQDKNVFVIKDTDGVELGRLEFEYANFQCTLPIAIGAIITSSTEANCAYGRFKSCQIYDNGILVRDFIPCINPDGEAGMWDKVENKFYGNAGSGEFIASE